MGLSSSTAEELEHTRSSRETVLTLVAGLSCMDALIHLGAAVDHAGQFPLYAATFALLAAMQIAWAALILWRPGERVLLYGCAFNAGILALWALSRTVGVPVAPRPWVPEPVGVADLIASVAELVVILAVWSIVMAPRLRIARYLSERAVLPIVALLFFASLYGVGAHAG